MNMQFKESFTKDLRKMRDKDLLNRAKAVIETVEQAQSLDEIPNKPILLLKVCQLLPQPLYAPVW